MTAEVVNMNRQALLKACRDAGYTGAEDVNAVRSWIQAENFDLTDANNNPIDLDATWAKVPTQRKALRLPAEEPATVAAASGSASAVARVNADGQRPARENSFALTPENLRRIAKRRAYDRMAKSGTRYDPAIGTRVVGSTVFDSADNAEVFGATVRLQIANSAKIGHYDERANDEAIIRNAFEDITGRAMTTYQDTTGGALVPPLVYSAELINLRERYGVIRGAARVVDMGDQLKFLYPKTNDPTGSAMYKVQDNTAITQTTPNFQTVTLDANHFGMLAQAPIRLVRTAALDIADVTAQYFAQGWAYNEDNLCFNGDGTSTYFGYLGIRNRIASSASNVGLITQGTGNTYAAIVLKDFQRVCGVVPTYANPTWYMHKAFYYQVAYPLLTSLGGVTQAEGAAGAPPMFLGHPVRFVQVMPYTTATSQVCAILGDLSLGAYFGDATALTDFAVSDQRYFDQAAIAYRSMEAFAFNCEFGVGDTSYAGPICALRTGS